MVRAVPEKNTWGVGGGGKKALPTTHVIRKFRTPTTHRIQFS